MGLFSNLFDKGSEAVAKMARDAAVQKWLDEIDEALKREKKWRGKASQVVEVYEQEKAAAGDAAVEGSSDFNILYANTETLAPSIYNNPPRPVVKRKIKANDPIARAAAQVLAKVLVQLNDQPDPNYTSFDELQRLAVTEALVPGRGLARFSYDAKIDGEGEARKVTYETICGDPVPWNRVVYGYAKNWADVPWQAYEHFMVREELEDTFGEELGRQIKLTHNPSTETDKDGEDAMPADAQGAKFAHVWEIWDKRSRKQIFISEGYAKVIKSNDDPLGLEGFFNSPRPICFVPRVKSLIPNILYCFYEKQARELDDVTRRIGALTRAMKIRGMYDGTIQGLEGLLTQPENTLIPAENVASLQQGQTLDKAIWLLPLEKLISVLQQLYLNRAQIIQTIQKLSGVADVMLGASQASETLGAQKMKENWGVLRLKRWQKEVQRFSRDCYRLQAEIAAKKFSPETLAVMTGLPFPSAQDKQMAQMQAQQLMAQADQMQAMAQSGQQVPPQAGQQLQQQLQQLQQVAGIPSWEEISQFLRSDSIRNFVIDIETNSTVDVEATEDKQQLSEFMNSMAQVLNGVMPMVKEGILPFDTAKALLASIVRKFRLDDDVEEAIDKMQPPQPQQDPAKQKVEAEMKRDEQKFQMDAQARQQELKDKRDLAQLQMQVEREKLEIQREKNRLDREMMLAKHAKDMEMLQAQTVAKTIPAAAPAEPAGGGEGD